MFKKIFRDLIIAFFLALIIGRFVVVGWPKVLFNHLSSDGDESAYLSLGLALKEEGVLSDGTRPPLYAALLLPVAEREWSYFTTAKLITLGLGVLTILAAFWAGAHLFGWQTALLAAFLLAANREFHFRSATVYADVLLALVMVGAWYFLIESVKGWRQSLVAGIFVGLAFLTKGSAPLLLAAWGVMALVHFRLAIFRQFHLLLTPLFFVIVSLPLFIYNLNTFGDPTYNFATSHIMWMDRLAQIDTANPADLPTAATYFATHDWADIVARMQDGLEDLNPVILRSVIPGRTIEPAWLGWLLAGLALAMLLVLLRYRRSAVRDYLSRHKNAYIFTITLYGLFYVFFTWYVAGSSAETRFIVPLLAPLYLLLADIVVTLLGSIGRWLKTGPDRTTNQLQITSYQLLFTLYRIGLASLIFWGVAWLVDTTWVERWALSIDPYQSDREANLEEEAMVQWLARDWPEGEAFVSFGPSKSLPLWKFPARFTIERLPVEIDSWSAMETYVQEVRPNYIILDEDTVRRRRQALADYFGYQEDKGLVFFESYPAGWVFDLAYPDLPCRWCIFSPATVEEPLATFENGVELLEWRMTPVTDDQRRISLPVSQSPNLPILRLHSGQTPQPLRLSLTWRTQQKLETNYTMFVHLTAPDGFVKAQQDQPPFNGVWPASQWQPGQLLADRYELELDESIAPGEYLLLAGLYNPATGERVPPVDGPAGPAPATVLLGKVEVGGE